MEHISTFIAVRKHTLEKQRQLRLFNIPSEKGSREWALFNAVRGDRKDLYRVARPRVRHVPVRSIEVPVVRFFAPNNAY